MILVCGLLLILVIPIVGCVIPPAYDLGMYHDEFQRRNAEKITFIIAKPTNVGDSFVGIYDWSNSDSGEIWWDVSDPSKNPRILGIMVYDKHNNIIVDNWASGAR